MRRVSWVILLAVVLALAVGAAGCDDAPAIVPAALQATPGDPAAMLEAAFAATEECTSLSLTFDADLQLTLDETGIPAEDAMLLSMFTGPLTVAGGFSYDNEAEAGQGEVTLGVAGITYTAGLRMLGEQMWLQMLGQWYDMSEALADQGLEEVKSEDLDLEAMEARMSGLGIDPLDWLGEVRLVGEESLDGAQTYHLSCAPDLELLLRDALVLIADEQFMKLVDSTGELQAGMDDMLAEADLQEAGSMLAEMFSQLTVDVWAGKDDSLVRKLTMSVSFIPTAEIEMDGLRAIELSAEVDLAGFNQPVVVEEPETVLPFSNLEGLFGEEFLLPFEDILSEATRS